jgi:hypothetical protein
VAFYPFCFKEKEAINMEKPLVSFAAAKDCKSLRNFFEEEEEEL